MNRRDFVKTAGAVVAAYMGHLPGFADDRGEKPYAMTVTGAVPAEQLGKMLPHEHVLVDFIGADQVSPDRYDTDEVYEVMLPFVKQASAAGCETIAECTPAYLGRDPRLLQRLSKATGVTFLTNTGYTVLA